VRSASRVREEIDGILPEVVRYTVKASSAKNAAAVAIALQLSDVGSAGAATST
jgi:hypothetical protein